MFRKSNYARKLRRIRKKNTFSLNMGKLIENEERKREHIKDFYNLHPMSYELLRGIPEEDLLEVVWEYVLVFAKFKEEGYFQRFIDTDGKIYAKVFLVYEFLETIHEYGFEMFGEMKIIEYTDEIINSLTYFQMDTEKNIFENTLDLFNFNAIKKEGIIFYENKKLFDKNNLSENDQISYKSNITKIKRSYNKNIEKLKELVKKEINYPEISKLSKFLKRISKI